MAFLFFQGITFLANPVPSCPLEPECSSKGESVPAASSRQALIPHSCLLLPPGAKKQSRNVWALAWWTQKRQALPLPFSDLVFNHLSKQASTPDHLSISLVLCEDCPDSVGDDVGNPRGTFCVQPPDLYHVSEKKPFDAWNKRHLMSLLL